MYAEIESGLLFLQLPVGIPRFVLVNSPIFFLMRPANRACTIFLGINSSLAMTPLPSMERGEIRNVAPLNMISGNLTSTSCVMANLIVLPYSALDTSSMGLSGLPAQMHKVKDFMSEMTCEINMRRN